MKFNKITYLYIFALFLSSIISSVAQETYRGNFQLTDTIAGQVEYSFVKKNNNNVFEGDFKFNYSEKFEDLFKSLSYQGQFYNNRKTGRWLFSSKNLIKSDSLNISGYQISYTANGFEYRVEGAFNDGKAHGNWLVVEQNFKNAQPADTIFSSKVMFENGKMVQQLKAKSQKTNFDGFFDDNGMANGTWIVLHDVDSDIIEEQRVYENGIFKNHFFKHNGEIIEIEHLGLDTTEGDDEANWEVIDIRNQYFNIFELSNVGFVNDLNLIEPYEVKLLSQKANDFMKKSIISFAIRDNFEIWNHITQEQEIEFGRFKVRKYPFLENEYQLISEITKNKKDISEKLDQFFNNPQIEIGRLNYESLNRYHAILQVYKNYAPQFNAVADKITSPSLEYLNRNLFVKSLAPSFDFGNDIKFSFNEDTFVETYDFPIVPSKENFTIETANNFFKAVQQDINSVFKNASIILNDLQKIEALTDLEESFVQKRNEIQKRFNNQNNDENYNTFHQDLSIVVQNFSEQQFKSYAALSLDQKRQQIDDYLACFDEVLNLYDFLADLQFKINRLDDTYIRTTFNPYLMVDMDERIKERLYNAYNDIAMPYLFKKMKNEFECDNIVSNTENIKNLMNKMSQLRDEDTAIKERQLRRVRDAIEVLNIFDLDIN